MESDDCLQTKSIEKILVAVDFSEQTTNLLDCLNDIYTDDIEELLLVHVIEDEKVFYDQTADYQTALTTLEKIKNKLGCKYKCSIDIKILLGEPSEEINQLAKLEDIDLIVVASSGKGYLKSTLLGSTTFDLMKSTNYPLFIEKGEIQKAEQPSEMPNRYKKIVVPTDFSAESLEALRIVRSLREHIGEVVFVYITDKNITTEQAELNLSELVEELSVFGIKASYRVESGNSPAKKILKIINEEQASLTIVSKIGAGLVEGLLIGSTAQTVALNADSSVLIVPINNNYF